MRFRLKTHTFRYVCPCVHAKTIRKRYHFHRNRKHLEALSKVETFENASFPIRIAFSVEGENGGF